MKKYLKPTTMVVEIHQKCQILNGTQVKNVQGNVGFTLRGAGSVSARGRQAGFSNYDGEE